MLTDRQLDECQRDFEADGWTWSAKFAAVVEQAKEANRFRRALLTIAAMGKKEDAKVAREVVEAI